MSTYGWEVSLPDPHNEGLFVASDPMSREEALRIARDVWGADEEGRICIVNETGVEED